MDSVPVTSSPIACSLTNGGSLCRSKHSNKNVHYASFYASKASRHRRKTQIECKFLSFQQPSLNHHYKYIGEGSTYQECNEKYIVKVSPGPYSDSESNVSYLTNILDFVKKLLVGFFLFTSPYAMMTQTLGIISAALLTVEKLSDISPLFFIGVLQVAIPHLFIGIYSAGVNQLCDLEIDKINKPYLPLASGKISFTTGVIIAASCLILSFWLGWIIGSWPLTLGILVCGLLWTAYSINVPLLRWKGNPLLAAMCIFITWAVVFPIFSFLHFQTFVFKRPTIFPRSLIFSVAFMSLYSLGLALCKDIPDVEGDETFGIYSFSSRLGQKRVFWICVSLFEMAFGIVFLAGVSSPDPWIKIFTGLGHTVLASILWYKAKSIDLKSKASIASFYMFTWKLLSAEYFLLPFIR